MRIGKHIFIILFTFILISTVSALTPDERVYFDAQSQKEIAQITAKIDGSETKIQNSMIKEFEDSTRFIEERINDNIKGSLKYMAIGLAGFMIFVLSIFRIIDLKLNKTRAIKNYENQLKKNIEETKQYAQKLNIYRQSLVNYHKNLANTPQVNSPKQVETKPVDTKKKLTKIHWMFWVVIVLAGIGMVIISVLQLINIFG